MTKYPPEKIDEVRDQADIERVVGRVVRLSRKGQNLWGLCPFHSEKTPSFSVSPDKRMFYCFGCRAGGDVFDFVMRLEGIEFPEAIRLLGSEFGVELPQTPEDEEVRKRNEERTLYYRVNELATKFYERMLRQDEQAKEYLIRERGLREETIEAFRLGWAPMEWTALSELLEKKGISPEVSFRLGLVGRSAKDGRIYDRLRGRIVFPIALPSREIAGFGARRADWVDESAPKYLNSPESPIYEKSSILYGLGADGRDAVRKERRSILVEGYVDVISLWQAGFKNAVAACGTALSVRHAGMLRKLTSEVITLYDGDTAGQEAARSSAEILLRGGLTVRIATLPQEDDPDTFVRSKGGESLQKLVDEAPSAVDFFLAKARAENAGGGIAGITRSIEAIKPMILAISDPLARDVAIQVASRILEVNERILRKHLSERGADNQGPRSRTPEMSQAGANNQGLRDRSDGADRTIAPDGTHSRDRSPDRDRSQERDRGQDRDRSNGTDPSDRRDRNDRRAKRMVQPPVYELAILRALIESPAETIEELEKRSAVGAFTDHTIRAAVEAGLNAFHLRQKFDAPRALEVTKNLVAEMGGDANVDVLSLIQKTLMDVTPQRDNVSECVTRLLKRQHELRLQDLKIRAAQATDPEVQAQLAEEVRKLMASRSTWEEKN